MSPHLTCETETSPTGELPTPIHGPGRHPEPTPLAHHLLFHDLHSFSCTVRSEACTLPGLHSTSDQCSRPVWLPAKRTISVPDAASASLVRRISTKNGSLVELPASSAIPLIQLLLVCFFPTLCPCCLDTTRPNSTIVGRGHGHPTQRRPPGLQILRRLRHPPTLPLESRPRSRPSISPRRALILPASACVSRSRCLSAP